MTLRERKLQALLIEALNMSDIKRHDLGYLALCYGLPFKTTCEYLESRWVIPCGTYQEIIQRGVTVRDIYALVHKRYPVIEKWKPE